MVDSSTNRDSKCCLIDPDYRSTCCCVIVLESLKLLDLSGFDVVFGDNCRIHIVFSTRQFVLERIKALLNSIIINPTSKRDLFAGSLHIL
ncbi:unnamed protein product [Caenorhabditis angaria]|uniref:Uncharacterized protein n=1 Tax=Caenorhabditis angaria TaxID=860376 RepID=A0A9P1J1N1_9PELO|nr:unnamed protein product [Caenorhabditis angaria]